MRIQKYLSEQNILSRRKAETCILEGLIKVNGVVVKTLGFQFDPTVDTIEIDRQIQEMQQKYSYLAFNKPKGIFTNCPLEGRKEIKDLLPTAYKHLNSIGRLDKDSEGLILFSDDGVFAKSILNAKQPHLRKYKVWLARPFTDEVKKRLEDGLYILGSKTQPVIIETMSQNGFIITMSEGKNRQIRRMLFSLNCKVIGLQRIAFGSVLLGDLAVGKYRLLTEAEVQGF